MHFFPPLRRVFGAGVEAFDHRQVAVQIRPGRRIDVDHGIDTFDHGFLNQRGVEVPGIEGNQFDRSGIRRRGREAGDDKAGNFNLHGEHTFAATLTNIRRRCNAHFMRDAPWFLPEK